MVRRLKIWGTFCAQKLGRSENQNQEGRNIKISS
jgi:hypothetical protein